MIKVLVVDDSAIVRRLVQTSLSYTPEIEVVGVAVDGVDAIAKVAELKPDAVTMDVEMPTLDGISAVREIRKTQPDLPIIMFSTYTTEGAEMTFEALAAGASDFVCKPLTATSISDSMAQIGEQLVPKLLALTAVPEVAPPPMPEFPPVDPKDHPVDIVVMGASTGGPDALWHVLPNLPADFPIPIMIVQHMPPVFTAIMAQRLDKTCLLDVVEATDGQRLQPGKVYLAPGDFHMCVDKDSLGAVVRLHEGPPEHFSRPAIDQLFRSAAEAMGERTLAVLLTGMGHDGFESSKELAQRGAIILAQDQASSVVWGIPGAVVQAGLANEVVPLDFIAQRITTHVMSTAGRS